MNKKGFFGMMALFVGAMLVLGGGQAFAQIGGYRSTIQKYCNFGTPGDVWAVIDSVTLNGKNISRDVYTMWSNSYTYKKVGTGMVASVPQDDAGKKALIRKMCQFTTEEMDAVWKTIETKHKFPDAFKKVWAESYLEGRPRMEK